MKYILISISLFAIVFISCTDPFSSSCNGTVINETKGSNHGALIIETDAMLECMVTNGLQGIEGFRDYPFLDIPIFVMGSNLRAGNLPANGCTSIDSFLLEFEIFIRSVPINSSFVPIDRHELKHVILKLVIGKPDNSHSTKWFSGNSPCPDGNEFVVNACPDFICLDDFFIRETPRNYDLEPFDQLRANKLCGIVEK